MLVLSRGGSNGTGISKSQTGNNSDTNIILTVMNSVTSIIKEVLHKDDKEDIWKKTLDHYTPRSGQSGNSLHSIDSSVYGVHPESLTNTDYVSDSLREKILSGKYVNVASLQIPEYEQASDDKKQP